jgi:hypothetical protein
MSLIEAATFLASTWPVFACRADKKPATAHGFKDATRDPLVARAMFRDPEAVLIGVPTGEGSDLAVWDFDTKYEGAGLRWLAENEHRIPPTRRHRTPSGGIHLLFRYPRGVRFGNSAGYLNKKTGKLVGVALGVDTRGNGGYICSPPSPAYEILDDAMPAEMPQWMIDAYLARKAEPPPESVTPYAPPRTTIPDRYAEAALKGECEEVASTAEGGRNHQLNISAVKLGSLVAAGALDRRTVEYELKRAAMHAGLDSVEAEKTIASGLGYGLTQPRQIPERLEHARAPSSPRAAAPDNPTQLTDGGQPKHLPLVYWNDIQPSLAADDFIEGLLIKGAMSVIYGPSNCGKTFWTSDLAMHVATGRKWQGRDIEPGGVIYCALEGGHGIRNRVAAWRKHYRLEGVEVPFAVIPVTLNLLDPDADAARVVEAIEEAKRQFGFPVVWTIMDTLSRAMAGGNENSPEDMGALVTNGTMIQQATGSHLTWIHHSGKDQAQGARGHSLLRAATDTEIEISRPDKDSPSTARVTKQRELEIEGEWVFGLEKVELGTNRRGKPVTSCVVVDAEAQERPRSIRLPPGARAALAALHEALIEAGQSGTHRDMPRDRRVVPVEIWRRAFYSRSHLENQDAKRKAFLRAVSDLRESAQVTVLNDFAWLADAGDE